MTTIGFHGNKTAPAGSTAWALALREEIRSSYSLAMIDLLAARIRILDQHQGWKVLKNERGKPFTSLTEFLTAWPMYGIGMNLDKVRYLLEIVSGADHD